MYTYAKSAEDADEYPMTSFSSSIIPTTNFLLFWSMLLAIISIEHSLKKVTTETDTQITNQWLLGKSGSDGIIDASNNQVAGSQRRYNCQ